MFTYPKTTQQMKLSTMFLVCLHYLFPVKFPNSLKWVKMNWFDLSVAAIPRNCLKRGKDKMNCMLVQCLPVTVTTCLQRQFWQIPIHLLIKPIAYSDTKLVAITYLHNLWVKNLVFYLCFEVFSAGYAGHVLQKTVYKLKKFSWWLVSHEVSIITIAMSQNGEIQCENGKLVIGTIPLRGWPFCCRPVPSTRFWWPKIELQW